MDSVGQRPRPRFQFHLATAIGVTTSFAVIFSLIKCHPVLGAMLSGLFVGSWWSRAAVRAGWRELAFCLAAWPMSVLLSAVGFVASGGELLRLWPDMDGSLFLLLVMYLACLLTVILLRPVIRKPGLLASAWTGVVAVYTATVAAWVFTFAGRFILGWSNFGDERPINVLMIGVMYSTVLATVLMPLAWPVSLTFCAILRWIDPKKTDVR
ncbi:MAG TPA: hypothetical protein VMY42_22765 [Thermoguttaceae bacterium]|nr:hypothetical protein [Thermoguttaceae bacterium]